MMYKLKNKQLIHLTKGKYHDGGGLYISITRQGKGLWTYRYRLNKKSHEMSLGTFPQVKLSEVLAVHLIASGFKDSNVSKKLGIREETLSRW